MKRHRWLNFAVPELAAPRWLGSISRAAAAGKPSDLLLEFSACAFLSAGNADLAGVCLERGIPGKPWTGLLVGSRAGRASFEHLVCSPSDLPQEILQGRTVITDDLPLSRSRPPFSWLFGMYSAVWLPLHIKHEIFGAAVIAYGSPRLTTERDVLESLAAEFSIVWHERRTRDRLDRLQQETESWQGLQRAMLRGVCGDQMLQAVASAAVRHTSAEFVALGRFLGTEVRWEAFAGHAEYSLLLRAPETRELVQSARQSGRPAAARLPDPSPATDANAPALASLLAHPLAAVAASGALLAGFSQDMAVLDKRLEPYAILASSALACGPAHSGSGQVSSDEGPPAERAREPSSAPFSDDLRLPALFSPDSREDATASQRQIQAKLLQTEKMAALGQLVSGIAHELNNPLTAIMGYGQLLLGHGLRPAQLSEARKIFQEAERARRIVKNLLFFARETQPERTRVDLNEIVERTLALRGYELRVENIQVECELDPGLPRTMADPYQLQQIVLNLLVNAEQALLQSRGRGHIWIRTRALQEDRIALEVADDGPGVPLEIASRIFDPFFSTKPPGVGTGLGLSIVYGIVHQHGGEITVESIPQSGAKFVVELPVVAVPATGGQEPAGPSAAPVAGPAALETLALAAPAAVQPARILVVEDETTVAQLIADVLREEGHQMDVVMDSQEGLNRIARTRYDLVICDLRMPRLDGPAFYEALVRTHNSAQDRILFITGDTLAPRTLEFLEPHGLPYLAKPFLVEELKLAVNRMLERTHSELRILPPAPDLAPEQETEAATHTAGAAAARRR